MREITVVFLSTPSFLHVMTNQPNPPHVLTYPIASCFPNRQLLKHIFYNNSLLFFLSLESRYLAGRLAGRTIS
jgi:hypothetical protein